MNWVQFGRDSEIIELIIWLGQWNHWIDNLVGAVKLLNCIQFGWDSEINELSTIWLKQWNYWIEDLAGTVKSKTRHHVAESCNMFKHVAVPTCRIEYLVATAKSIELTWNLAGTVKIMELNDNLAETVKLLNWLGIWLWQPNYLCVCWVQHHVQVAVQQNITKICGSNTGFGCDSEIYMFRQVTMPNWLNWRFGWDSQVLKLSIWLRTVKLLNWKFVCHTHTRFWKSDLALCLCIMNGWVHLKETYTIR